MSSPSSTVLSERAFLAHHLRRLADRISNDSDLLLQDRGIRLNSRTVSALLLLARNPQSTASELAIALGLPHQLVSQRLTKLRELGFIEITADPADARRRQIVLTVSGQHEVEKLRPVLEEAEVVFGDLGEEIGVDLAGGSIRGLKALEDRSLRGRFDAARGGSR